MVKMRDNKVSYPRVQLLHPLLRDEVERLIIKAESLIHPDLSIRVTQSLRTIKEQNGLYAQGRTTKGNIVTNAKGGQSFHNYGLALDFVFIYKGKADWSTEKDFDKDGISDWREVAKVFTDAGWVWGGNFKSIKDKPHLEKTFKLGWRDLLSRYNAGDVFTESGYEYVNIEK